MAGNSVTTICCATCRFNSDGCTLPSGGMSCLERGRYLDWQPAVTSATKDSGSHASYYVTAITNPKSSAPYTAECQDIIEALKMDFNEGNAFKALWRRAAARLGKVKKGNEDPLYDAQKIAFYGERILKQEEHK